MHRIILPRFSHFAGSAFLTFSLIAFIATFALGSNVVIDHTNWNWYDSQNQTVIEAVAGQKIFFAHASVGGNVLSGLSDLHTTNSTKYPLVQYYVDPLHVSTLPASTVNGTIYECPRGNPSWADKVSNFETYIGYGWRAPKVDFVMNKFCFIDEDADWTVYRDSMVALEAANSGAKFVYWTMPLKTDMDSDQVLRAQFNQNLRNWIATQDHKIFFDIADIEAWNLAGVHQTFIYNGTAYEKLAADYSYDGGHLNQTGYDRVATGLYSLLGQATLPPGVTPTPGTPAPTATPGTPTPAPTSTPGISSALEVLAYPNPSQEEVNFDIPTEHLGTIEIRIYNFQGELLGHKNALATAGQHTVVKFDCTGLAPGVYLAQIEVAGKKLKNLKFAVKR